MWKSLILLFVLTLVGCEFSKSSDCENFSQKDSTLIINNILDSMRSEMNRQWFMKPAPNFYDENKQNYSTCLSLPNFMENNKPPYFRQEMFFEIDSNNSVKLNGVKTNKNIEDKVDYFFSKNRISNHVDYDFALYITLTRKNIYGLIEYYKENIKDATNYSNHEIKQFFESYLQQNYSKLSLLNTMSSDTLYEPYFQTCVKLLYQKNCKINEKIQERILMGFYRLREKDAKTYFEESYAKIFWKATKFDDTLAKRKLEALSILHPIYLLDYGKTKFKPKLRYIPPPPKI